jgi:hypothetical protein
MLTTHSLLFWRGNVQLAKEDPEAAKVLFIEGHEIFSQLHPLMSIQRAAFQCKLGICEMKIGKHTSAM